MRHRNVGELMTREVITVARTTAFKDIVRTLAEHQVSAVPVVDSCGE
ncbi:CBS domain-containing protein [Streptomyces sp. NPDC058067]